MWREFSLLKKEVRFVSKYSVVDLGLRERLLSSPYGEKQGSQRDHTHETFWAGQS